MKTESLFKRWSEEGFRITPVRRAMVDFFISKNKPLSISEITVMLKKKGISPNKTTLYRELCFLADKGFINELHLPGKKRFYDIQKFHHHHLICSKCASVREIESREMENVIKAVQARLKKDSDFDNIVHSLEFFGLCPKCKS
jgi:Fur family ferric uptake transcriptional regulator